MPVDPAEIRSWAASHRATWELLPLVEMIQGERRQIGHVLNLYARIPVEIPPSEERSQAILALWDRLREIALSLGGLGLEGERVEVGPFDAAGRLRPETRFVPEIQLTARIVHPTRYLEAVAADEREHMRPLEERLRELGLRPGHW